MRVLGFTYLYKYATQLKMSHEVNGHLTRPAGEREFEMYFVVIFGIRVIQ